MGEQQYACRVPGCEKSFGTAKGRAGHERLAHALASTNKPIEAKTEGGEAVTQEKETKEAIKQALAEEKKAEEQAQREESEKSGIVAGIKGIGDRLDKIDTDFCSKFPELCKKVDRLEEAIPKKREEGSEEWKTETRAGLEHVLFDECPNCGPLRDEVLSAKGKRLADVEAEAKVDEVETKVDEVETKVDEEPELKTSGGYFPGSKWDDEKELYVEQR
ncbi:hypothetical protein ES703_18792 [subsurface metagenome]